MLPNLYEANSSCHSTFESLGLRRLEIDMDLFQVPKLVTLFIFIEFSYCELKPCGELQNSSVTVLCKNKESQRTNSPPQPFPVKVTPIIDFKDIIDIDSEEKTMSTFIKLILTWTDEGIGIVKGKKNER